MTDQEERAEEAAAAREVGRKCSAAAGAKQSPETVPPVLFADTATPGSNLRLFIGIKK